MQKLKKIGKNLLFVTLPAMIVIFLVLEIISRLFFPGKDAPKMIYDENSHLVKYSREYGKTGIWSAGKFAQQRARWRINNDGWKSSRDFDSLRHDRIERIAIIGDSYIEAWQVDNDKAYPELLNDSLGSTYEVYRFGVSGQPLSQYLHIARYVDSVYRPDTYIFNLVHNDFHESINGLSHIPFYMTVRINEDSTISEIRPVKPENPKGRMPGGFLFRNSSLCRWVYYNLNMLENFKSKRVDGKEIEMGVGGNEIMRRKDSLRMVTQYLLKKIKEELRDKQVIFVMDAPRWNIYSGDLATARLSWLNNMVGEVCKELELPFIDLTPYMEEDYKKNGKKFETGYDGHWNEYGHRFVANVVYNYLKKNKRNPI